MASNNDRSRADAKLFRILYPEESTEPFANYVHTAAELITFGHRIFDIAETADEGALGAVMHAAVRSGIAVNLEAVFEIMRKTEAPPKPIFRPIVSAYERLMAEMTLCRGVDNFLTYVASLLRLVFVKRPETLKSKEQVSTEQVLVHSSIDDFVRWLADKRVHELSYQGIRDLNGFFATRLGIPMLQDQDVPDANRIIETRNLLAHNRGIINERFVSRVGEQHGAVGDHIRVSLDEAVEVNATLWGLAARLDVRAAKHFGLPTPVSWPLPDDSDSDDHARSKSEGK